jgi:Tfp pilus assembly protein PilO
MDLSKFTRAHVFITGAIVAVILGAGFYFLGVRKTNENITTLNGRLSTARATIATEKAKQEDLAKAKKEVAEVQSSLTVYRKTKMPNPPIDLRAQDPKSQVLTMMNLWGEPRRLYHMANQFALNTNDVAVRTQFGVPSQPSDPRLIPTSIIELPLGQVTAYGEFRDIMSYMRRWNRFGRVVAVDNLVLTGTSPMLSGTAQLTVYIFPEVNPGQEQQQATDTSGGYGSPYGGYGGGPGMSPYPGASGPSGPPGGPPGGPGGAPNGP